MSSATLAHDSPPVDAAPEHGDAMTLSALRGTWSLLDHLDFRELVIDVTAAARVLGVHRETVRRMSRMDKWRPLLDVVGRGTRRSGLPYTDSFLAHRVAVCAYLRGRRGPEMGPDAYDGIEEEIRRALAYPDDVVRGAQQYLARLVAPKAAAKRESTE